MENSIEEDMNYLDSMVKEYKQFGNLYNEDYEDEDRIYQAIDHILSDYKRVLKENEELKENKTGLEEEIQEQAKNLMQNEEYIAEECILKDKIKNEIEELKNEKEQLQIDNNVLWDSGIYKLDIKLTALQALLEGED